MLLAQINKTKNPIISSPRSSNDWNVWHRAITQSYCRKIYLTNIGRNTTFSPAVLVRCPVGVRTHRVSFPYNDRKSHTHTHSLNWHTTSFTARRHPYCVTLTHSKIHLHQRHTARYEHSNNNRSQCFILILYYAISFLHSRQIQTENAQKIHRLFLTCKIRKKRTWRENSEHCYLTV